MVPNNLIEETRPTLYRGLKYWGKKPHNIWRHIIEHNSNKSDVIYDPFAGSGLTFYESIKVNRKPVICDINPLTLFLVDVYSKNYDQEKIVKTVASILSKMKRTAFYKKNFTTNCSNCGETTDIYNYRCENNEAKSYSYKCKFCGATKTDKNTKEVYNYKHKLWKPSFDLNLISSTNEAFYKKMGGSNISFLWTPRNLEFLSMIFSKILDIKGNERDSIMYGFIQTLHLTTKMCSLRSKKTRRPLSTSWGRPAYLGLSSYMEQNPILQLERAIFGNAGVLKAIQSREKYLPQYTYSTDIRDIDKVDGVVLIKDSKEISSGFKPKLIMLDPPYGSIIQYGELSLIWNVWLEKYNSMYKISLENEIIVNKTKGYDEYTEDMTRVLTNCSKLLCRGGGMVMTFNSNNDEDWSAIEQAINNASNLHILDKKYQKNLRSSEANVSDNKGIGISDYYITIGKKRSTKKKAA